MTKSNGLNEIRIAVFISGKGSNLKNLIKFSDKAKNNYKVALIVSNDSKAEGLKYSKQFH